MGKRKESLTLAEQEKAKVFHAEGRTYHSIAKSLKRSPHTIKKYLIKPEVVPEIQRVKKELADMFEDLAIRMINSISPEDISKINAYQRTLSGGIAIDKMRLLRGQSTERVDYAVLTANLSDLQKERERLELALNIRKLDNR
jgi:hypothetical protein